MEKLTATLRKKIVAMKKKTNSKIDITSKELDDLYSIFPFNKFEYVISHLIATQTINLDEYLKIRTAYMKRNKYLYVFEITAPRTFGETWAQRHLNELVQELEAPSKEDDSNYDGQYDFWYDGIRIEVKASRAVKQKSGDTLIMKALSSDSKCKFDMNFQQLKPKCCDVFVWIGVWRDKIRYWVLSNTEVRNNKYYSKGQHRGNVDEGQLWIKESNITDFEQYEVKSTELLQAIINKGRKRNLFKRN